MTYCNDSQMKTKKNDAELRGKQPLDPLTP